MEIVVVTLSISHTECVQPSSTRGKVVGLPQFLESIDGKCGVITTHLAPVLMKGLGNIGIRNNELEPVFLGEGLCVIKQPEVLLPSVHVASIIDTQMGNGLSRIGRIHIVLDAIEGVDTTGTGRPDTASIRHKGFGQGRSNPSLVKNSTVVREGRNEVSTELIKELCCDRSLADNVHLVTHGVEQEADEEGVGAFVAEVLGIGLIKLNPQGTGVDIPDTDVSD